MHSAERAFSSSESQPGSGYDMLLDPLCRGPISTATTNVKITIRARSYQFMTCRSCASLDDVLSHI